LIYCFNLVVYGSKNLSCVFLAADRLTCEKKIWIENLWYEREAIINVIRRQSNVDKICWLNWNGYLKFGWMEQCIWLWFSIYRRLEILRENRWLTVWIKRIKITEEKSLSGYSLVNVNCKNDQFAIDYIFNLPSSANLNSIKSSQICSKIYIIWINRVKMKKKKRIKD
jgi:hypothetical protein